MTKTALTLRSAALALLAAPVPLLADAGRDLPEAAVSSAEGSRVVVEAAVKGQSAQQPKAQAPQPRPEMFQSWLSLLGKVILR